MNDLILYTTEDGLSEVQLRADQNTVWFSQREMAGLFDVIVDNIDLHLKNIYQDGELIREADLQDDAELKALEAKIRKRKQLAGNRKKQ